MAAASGFGTRLVPLAAASAFIGVGLAFLLAIPDYPNSASWLRVIATASGSSVLGLGVLTLMDAASEARRPAVDSVRMWRTVGYLAGLWTGAEVLLLVLAAGDAAGQSIIELPPSTFVAFVTSLSVGRLGVVTVLLTLAICMLGVVGFRRAATWSPVPLVGLAALALVIRPITGHMSQFAFGSILVALHVLCAACWLGVLAAMALSLRSKSAWSTLLPSYSRIAFWCVLGVASTGLVNALLKLDGPVDLFQTSYGRIVLAKIVLTAVLVLLGRWIRRTWLVSAAAHRTSADESILRAGLHVCVLAVAFGLAAALATTA